LKITTTTAADKSIKNLSERLDDLYPDEDGPGKGLTHWKEKPIIPAEEWKKISGHNRLEFTTSGLKAFPDDLVPAVFVLFFEGYDEDIYPYHDGDPRPGTDEWKQSLDLPDENKLRKLGDYNHIHTIRVVPGDGREPYLIHDIEVDTK
jgi:hypothetical protein